MSRKQIDAVLEIFKERVDAIAVGLVRADKHEVYRRQAPALWSAVQELDCLNPKPWVAIRQDRAGTTEVTCTCGHHFASSFAIDGLSRSERWILMALTHEPLSRAADESPLVITVAETAVHGALVDLREILREMESNHLDLLGPEPSNGSLTELAIPLWWARKPS